MVLIGKRCLGPDIWPETVGQAKSIKSMMTRVWFKEVQCQQRANKIKTCALSLSGKEFKHIYLLIL